MPPSPTPGSAGNSKKSKRKNKKNANAATSSPAAQSSSGQASPATTTNTEANANTSIGPLQQPVAPPGVLSPADSFRTANERPPTAASSTTSVPTFGSLNLLPPETVPTTPSNEVVISMVGEESVAPSSSSSSAHITLATPPHHQQQSSHPQEHHKDTQTHPFPPGAGLYRIPSRAVIESRKFHGARMSDEEIEKIKNSGVRKYYEDMNELLDKFEEVDAILKHADDGENNNHNHITQHQLQQRRRSSLGRPMMEIVHDDRYGAIGTSANAGVPITDATVVVPGSLQDQDTDLEMGESAPLLGGAGTGTGGAGGSGNNKAVNGATPASFSKKKKTSPTMIELALDVSLGANIVLVLLKIWSVLASDSLAVLASMVDSFMDLLSGIILWYSNRARSQSDQHSYPVGKTRMEPLGIIVFASVMVTCFAQVMMNSLERLLEGSDTPPVDLSDLILILLGINILAKFLLWVWCRSMKDSSSVQALAQDHLNDVVFNIFSTIFPVAGSFLGLWWLDAAGAIVLSIYIIREWVETCLDNIKRLTGHTATPADIQQLTYMTYRFSKHIQAIDTVRAYYVGDALFCEVDIVLPPTTPLSLAHDIGEALQEALEKLDNVERAFVHLDYDFVHQIEHRGN